MPVTEQDNMIARRMLIESLWRKVFGADATTHLVASEKEWQFYNALLDELYQPGWIQAIKYAEPNSFINLGKIGK